MKEVIKKKWVAALRSGEYKQGQRQLHNADGDKFCCLGVLCDLAAKEGIVKRTLSAHGGFYLYDNYDGFLPPSVRNWAQIDPSSDQVPCLVYLNDRGDSFDTIANVIEKVL